MNNFKSILESLSTTKVAKVVTEAVGKDPQSCIDAIKDTIAKLRDSIKGRSKSDPAVELVKKAIEEDNALIAKMKQDLKKKK
jgi:hypothetical protein